MTRTVSLWGPVALYMAAIFFASAQSGTSIPLGVGDKPTHVLAYAGLGVLVVRALAGGLPSRITLMMALAGAMLATAYGMIDEIHQMFVPGRHAEWSDVLADAIGGGIGAAACWLWGIIRVPREESKGTSRHGL